jgi:hypothetical protein
VEKGKKKSNGKKKINSDHHQWKAEPTHLRKHAMHSRSFCFSKRWKGEVFLSFVSFRSFFFCGKRRNRAQQICIHTFFFGIIIIHGNPKRSFIVSSPFSTWDDLSFPPLRFDFGLGSERLKSVPAVSFLFDFFFFFCWYDLVSLSPWTLECVVEVKRLEEKDVETIGRLLFFCFPCSHFHFSLVTSFFLGRIFVFFCVLETLSLFCFFLSS